ncbi:oligopeptide transporter [Xylariaceae sp. FL0804]|nr:oligopeptide transporter [Xylariaceae sp. FL0804]
MALFGGVLSGIYYFKPQTILISTVFVGVIAFFLGEAWTLVIPRTTRIGRILNPFQFNSKEHLVVTIMGASASYSALGMELMSVERLYYGKELSAAVSIFMLFSSQILGYGLAGLMRRTLVYPKSMLWPYNLPVNSMIENLHTRRPENRKPLKLFLIIFVCIFCWEIVPEWIMPLLTGFSIFCLADRHSSTITYIFGGSSGNEGLGLLSLCFDWQYISGGLSPLYFPIDSLISQGFGTCMCIIVFCGVYFGNVWNAKQFPFLSQTIFPNNTTFADVGYVQWNQQFVIGPDNKINETALDLIGLPWFATTNAIYNVTTNMATTGTITFMLLWYPREIFMAAGFLDVRKWKLGSIKSFPQRLKQQLLRGHEPDDMQDHYDPHYKLMRAYKACPDWWYAVCLLVCFAVGMGLIYSAHSTLPWWGFVVAMALAYVLLLFFGSMQAITGIPWLLQGLVQLIGGYMMPHDPVSNMWFSLYGFNAFQQGVYMAQDLKLAQYGHLAPRVTFFAQMFGTVIGCLLNYVMANEIITNQFDILLSVEGTNIWSGQQAQAFNSGSITSSLAHELFSFGGTYQWTTLIMLPGFLLPVPCYYLHKWYPNFGWNMINVPVIVYYTSYLSVGINSSLTTFFALGFGAQWWVRRRWPDVFVRYNYLVSAALDGGTSVMCFILSFAVFGAGGLAVAFPEYWGNNANGNYDFCKYSD